jgi:hypothetical protein
VDVPRSWRVALLACAAGAITWFVFRFEWSLYVAAENRPTYYGFSDYLEYRQDVGTPIGIAYAVLTATLVVGARLLGGRWRVALSLAAASSIALPVAVPAVLPRAEYGKDPVFHTPYSYEDPSSGRPVVCFAYGVERIGAPAPAGERDVCLQLPDRNTAPRLVTGRPLALDPDTPSRLAEALNESGIRPRDPVENLSNLDGIEIVRATWGIPQEEVRRGEPTDDLQTKRLLERLAKRLDACGATDGYVPCTDIDALARVGIFVGAGEGEVTIGGVTRSDYTITGQSTSGTAFSIIRQPGRPAERVCAPGGEGGCPSSGSW